MPQMQFDPGTYVGQVVRHVLTEARTGTVQWAVTFLVTHKLRESDRTPVPVVRAERTYYRAITDKTLPYLQQDVGLCGIEWDSIASLYDLDERSGTCDLRSREMLWQCVSEERNGIAHERWYIARYQATETSEVSAEKIHKLDRLLGIGRRKRAGKASVESVDTTGDVPTVNADDGSQVDDIPF